MEADAYPYWSDAELEEMRTEAIDIFVERYKTESGPAYAAALAECAAEVEELFDATDDLRRLGKDDALFTGREGERLLNAARYLTAPAISKDVLNVVAAADGIAATLRRFLDRERLPWLDEGRSPNANERREAQKVTAKLMAEQRHSTKLRTKLSRIQERAVRDLLSSIQLAYVEPSEVRQRLEQLGDSTKVGITSNNYQEALGRGEFTREIPLEGAKCDVPVRLSSGELLPIECKVSNSSVNSVKRLNRETGGKHDGWRSHFGSGLHTVAVLGGVYRLTNLKAAQTKGIIVVFDHRLDALERFIAAGGRPRAPR